MKRKNSGKIPENAIEESVEDELNESEDELNGSEEELNESDDELNGSEEELNESEDDLNGSEDELNESDEEINADESDGEINADESEEIEEEYDLEASATDSDENESDNDSKNDSNQVVETQTKSKSDLIREEVLQRYQERKGKQLYIRFPHKIPETEESLEEKVKEFAPLAVKVHKPRQRHARFCLVDFATNEDRDSTLKKLKKAIKSGDLEKYVVNIPRTESENFVNELAERKIKSIENKKAKNRLKSASKKALVQKNFTSSIIVFNLPETTSLVQLQELFPNAVDIQIKAGKGKLYKGKSIGAITLPTPMDARKALKNTFSLRGNKLIVKFDNQRIKKKYKSKVLSNKNSNKDDVENESEPQNKKPKLMTSDASSIKVEKKEKTAKKVGKKIVKKQIKK